MIPSRKWYYDAVQIEGEFMLSICLLNYHNSIISKITGCIRAFAICTQQHLEIAENTSIFHATKKLIIHSTLVVQ